LGWPLAIVPVVLVSPKDLGAPETADDYEESERHRDA